MTSSRHITSFDRPSCQDVVCFIYFGAADHLICKDQFLVHFSSLQYSLLEERSRGLPLWCEQLLQDMFYAGTIFAVASNQAERAEKTYCSRRALHGNVKSRGMYKFFHLCLKGLFTFTITFDGRHL